MSRISESELVLPALFIMSMQSDGKITTSKLIQELEQLLKPTGQDAQILAGRHDTYFSQKVRNLKSHSTFERYGYAENTKDGFRITSLGKQFVEAKKDILKYLFYSGDMDFIDISTSCDDILASHTSRKVIPLTETVLEGRTTRRESIIYERSSQLRQIAREHFMGEGGILFCECCNYEYSHYHRSPYNQSCIEIHHKKPLYLYEDSDIEQTFKSALANLMPVCPNCHRLIHKNKITAEQIELFKNHCYKFVYE